MVKETPSSDFKQLKSQSRRQQIALYTQSVSQLICLSTHSDNTNASEVAASVLLSAYNSFEFKVAIADLILLGIDGMTAATYVIYLRSLTGLEPHLVIENGRAIFSDLQRIFGEYAKYHHDAVGTSEYQIFKSGDESALEEIRVL